MMKKVTELVGGVLAIILMIGIVGLLLIGMYKLFEWLVGL